MGGTSASTSDWAPAPTRKSTWRQHPTHILPSFIPPLPLPASRISSPVSSYGVRVSIARCCCRYDTETGKEVAWNTVNLARIPTAERKRVRMETEILASLRHPHIISFYHVWEKGSAAKEDMQDLVLHFTTEIVTSGTLKHYTQRLKHVKVKVIKKCQPSYTHSRTQRAAAAHSRAHYPAVVALAVVLTSSSSSFSSSSSSSFPACCPAGCRQILSALVYLHSHSPPIIHRDLKCDNIFINGSTGEVRIGDFGLSVARHSTHVESVLGTPEFMAPELYDENYSESVDVYAFGMCASHTLTHTSTHRPSPPSSSSPARALTRLCPLAACVRLSGVLEMTTKEYPFQECSNAAQIWKKVSAGQRPEVLTRVNDFSLRSFIECCLLPASQRLSAREMLQHPFLAWKRSDPWRDGLLVVVDVKGGVQVGKAGAKDGEEERVLKELEREGKRKEEEEERRMRDAIQQQHRHHYQGDSRTTQRPQPIDTSAEASNHPSPQQSPPNTQPGAGTAYLSPTANSSTTPSPTLKRDMSMPSRLPSQLLPQQPSTAPTPALSPSNHSPSPFPHPSQPTISTRLPHHFPPPMPSPQSAPVDGGHPGAVTSVHVDVESSVGHLSSVSLHIHFAVEKRKKQIRFEYNLRDDTSVNLASEMVRALNLGDQERMIMVISATLEERIDPYRRAYFDSMREGGAAAGDPRMRSSGLHVFPHHPAMPQPLMPHPEHHALAPLHTSGHHAHFNGPPQPYPMHPQSTRHATHRPFPSSGGFAPSTPQARSNNPPLQRPPSLQTTASPHVSGSYAVRPGGVDKSRYQTLPQGFQFPTAPPQFAKSTGGTPGLPHSANAPPPPGRGPPMYATLREAPSSRPAVAVNGTPSGSSSTTREHGGGSPASSSPPVAPSNRRSSMPLQQPPQLSASAGTPIIASSPPAIVSPRSAAAALATSGPAFNFTAPVSVLPRLSSTASHSDSWTAYYRSLTVSALKEQVKARLGEEALGGAVDKAELIQLLVEGAPPSEWPPSTAAQSSKKSSYEDKAIPSTEPRDSQPSSRHSSHNDAHSSTSPLAASPKPTLSPLDAVPSLSPASAVSPVARSPPAEAPTDEWANLAFDVVGAAKASSEEVKDASKGDSAAKEMPRRVSAGFRDLDPLFSSPSQPAQSLAQPPLSSPSSESSHSSLYDLASLSPSQPFPSSPSAGEHVHPSARGASSAFFGDLLSPSHAVAEGEAEGGSGGGGLPHHRKGGGRNSILHTASIDVLSELVLGKGAGGGARLKEEKEREAERADEASNAK